METTTAPLTSQKLHRTLKAAGLSKSESGASGRIAHMNTVHHAGYHLNVEKDTVYRCARCHSTSHTSDCFKSISKYGKPRWRQTSTPTGRITVEYQGRTMGRWTDENAAEATRVMQVAREACIAAGFKVTDNPQWDTFTVEAQS